MGALTLAVLLCSPAAVAPDRSPGQGTAIAGPERSKASQDHAGTPAPFVRSRGNQLVLGDRPFRFVGANLGIMHHGGQRDRAEEVIAAAAADGLTVGRIWALGEGPVDASGWLREHFLFRAGPDGWLEAPYRQLDRVLVAARRHGLRLIITLSNHWADFGGVPQYLRWAGRWDEKTFGARDRFYSDPRCRAEVRAHVSRLLERRNSETGVAYRDDPTILAWELMNESDVVTEAGARARLRWMAEMAAFVKARAPDHLVASGVSAYRTVRQRAQWLQICRLPQIDLCDGHLYPEQLLTHHRPEALDAVLDDYVQNARFVVGKPFFVGEFGFAEATWQGQPRAHWLGRIVDRLAGNGAAGGLVWIYQPWTGTERDHAIFVGDPRGNPARAALAASAARLAKAPADGGPPLGPRGRPSERLPLHTIVEPPGTVPALARVAGGGLDVRWEVDSYRRALWESFSVNQRGALEYVVGTDSGWFEYHYQVAPPEEPSPGPGAGTLTLRFRASSEFPGALSPPGPAGRSRVRVTVDGEPLGTVLVPGDDGQGRWITVHVRSRALARRARSPGLHRLRLEVPPGPRGQGLCLYGRATGQPPLPDRPLPRGPTGPITLELR
jgi:hypothetical protein